MSNKIVRNTSDKNTESKFAREIEINGNITKVQQLYARLKNIKNNQNVNDNQDEILTQIKDLNEKIYSEYKNFIFKVAREISLERKLNFDEVLSAGYMAFLSAVKYFDVSKNNKFLAYWSKFIKQKINSDPLLNKSFTSDHNILYEQMQLNSRINELTAKLGREPYDNEIIDGLNIRVEEYHRLTNKNLSLQDEIYFDDGKLELGDTITDNGLNMEDKVIGNQNFLDLQKKCIDMISISQNRKIERISLSLIKTIANWTNIYDCIIAKKYYEKKNLLKLEKEKAPIVAKIINIMFKFLGNFEITKNNIESNITKGRDICKDFTKQFKKFYCENEIVSVVFNNPNINYKNKKDLIEKLPLRDTFIFFARNGLFSCGDEISYVFLSSLFNVSVERVRQIYTNCCLLLNEKLGKNIKMEHLN